MATEILIPNRARKGALDMFADVAQRVAFDALPAASLLDRARGRSYSFDEQVTWTRAMLGIRKGLVAYRTS